MNTVFLIDVSRFNDDTVFERYYNLLSNERKSKIDRYKQRKAKNLSVGAGILIDRYLKKFGMAEKDMTYIYGKNGKPFFKNSDIFFNISHSGTVAIGSFSDNETGCDIQICEGNNCHVIARRFFTANEYNHIMESACPSETFYRIWTIKESYLKFTGDGIGRGLDFFEVDLQNNAPQILKDNQRLDLFIKEYQYKNYLISVCSRDNNFGNMEILSEF